VLRRGREGGRGGRLFYDVMSMGRVEQSRADIKYQSVRYLHRVWFWFRGRWSWSLCLCVCVWVMHASRVERTRGVGWIGFLRVVAVVVVVVIIRLLGVQAPMPCRPFPVHLISSHLILCLRETR